MNDSIDHFHHCYVVTQAEKDVAGQAARERAIGLGCPRGLGDRCESEMSMASYVYLRMVN